MKPAHKQVFAVLIIVGLFCLNWVLFSPYFLAGKKGEVTSAVPETVSAVREENGKQIIHIVADHGYNPSHIVAKANEPTVLEMELGSNYDCSAGLRIPALKVQQFLKSGSPNLIDVPPQAAGTTLTGLCSMGMFKFEIAFN